jgi:hypothetical protein
VTANYVLGTVSVNTICGILNPADAPTTVFLKRTILTVVTGTLATGAFVWGVASAGNVATITSTGKEPVRHWVATTAAGKHAAKYYAGDTTSSVLAGATANAVTYLRPFAGGVAGATTAGAPYTFEEVDHDDLFVAPGTFLGLFVASSATACTVQAAITVNEGG